jgi:hypothetical protein
MIEINQLHFAEAKLRIALARIAIVGTISTSSYASIGDVPSPFRRHVQCMMIVLKKTPRVDQVESGALLDDGWMHPFMQYRYQEQDGRAGTVRFVAQKLNASKDTAQYLALLNGLSTPDGPPPPTFWHRRNRDAVGASMQSAGNGGFRVTWQRLDE